LTRTLHRRHRSLRPTVPKTYAEASKRIYNNVSELCHNHTATCSMLLPIYPQGTAEPVSFTTRLPNANAE